MRDLGEAKRILGMDIKRNRGLKTLFLSQELCIKKALKKFTMHQSKIVSAPLGQHIKLSSEQSPVSDEEKQEMIAVSYASGVGSVKYEMVCSRPDLTHAISLVSRFMENPGRAHWEALKWIMRYLNGTSCLGLLFGSQGETNSPVVGYVDSDYAWTLIQGSH